MSDHLDLVLRVLDHQIVGPDDEMLGNVDDLELTPAGAPLAVTGLAPGPSALARRLPGRLGSWTGVLWRRLRPEADPQPTIIPIGRVMDVGSAILVDDVAARELAAALGLERWLREHVISRIPGATGGGDKERETGNEEDGAGPRPGPTVLVEGPPVREPRPDSRWLSSLLGVEVRDDSGRLIGKVLEIRCDTSERPWRITHLQCTRSALGAELGYHADPRQGPALVGAVVRHWQRHDVLVPVTDIIDIERDPARIVVTSRDDRQHPHAGARRARETRGNDPGRTNPGGSRGG